MALALHHISVDCVNAIELARFWAAALDKELGEGDEEFASIGGRGSTDGQAWLFAKVPEAKSAKNRVHVDLRSDDRVGDVERLVGLGATIVAEHDEWNTRWTVLADPEGNEFCVVHLTVAD